MSKGAMKEPPAVPQPHNLEAEQSVLGAILLSDVTLYGLVVDAGLEPSDFYRDRHATIYEAMVNLYRQSEPVDSLTVTEQLRRTNNLEAAGGAAAVEALSGMVPSAGNVEHYSKIVKTNSLLRRVLIASYETQSRIANNDGTPEEILSSTIDDLLAVQSTGMRSANRSFASLAGDFLERLDSIAAGNIEPRPTLGIPTFDKLMTGFHPGSLIYLAARPSVGKTSIAVQFAVRAALEGFRCFISSAEMTDDEIFQKAVALDSGLLLRSLTPNQATTNSRKLTDIAGKLAALPIELNDSSSPSVTEIRAAAHQASRQGLDLIIVDYVQLVKTESKFNTRNDAVQAVSQSLKALAKDLRVPVVALSQLNRSPESRPDRRPQLSDLRDSGALEQDGDVVVMLHRDEETTRDLDIESPGTEAIELLIRKNRLGQCGEVLAHFNTSHARFTEAPVTGPTHPTF